MEQLLTITMLATVLNRAPATVRNDLSRAPHRLPPPVRIGSRVIGWRPQAVEEWLCAHEQREDQTITKQRGRPRKACSAQN